MGLGLQDGGVEVTAGRIRLDSMLAVPLRQEGMRRVREGDDEVLGLAMMEIADLGMPPEELLQAYGRAMTWMALNIRSENPGKNES